MDKETREALEASIKHWEENAAVDHLKDVKLGEENCALCRLFIRDSCKGCPIFENDTNQQYCIGTPYYAAHSARRGEPPSLGTFRMAAQEMVDFLKSLRPEEEELPDVYTLFDSLRGTHGFHRARYLAKAYLFRLRARKLEEGDLLRDIVFDTYPISLQEMVDIEEVLK